MASEAENSFQKLSDMFEGGYTILGVRFSKSVSQIMPALIKASQEFDTIHLDGKVRVTLKSGASYSFDYATYGELVRATKPHLLNNKVMVLQPGYKADRDFTVCTFLMHESGEYVAFPYSVPIANPNDPKEVGGANTFAKRYSYAGILALIAEDDNDAPPTPDMADIKPERRRQSAAQQQKPPNNQQRRSEVKPSKKPEHEETIQKLKEKLTQVGVEPGDKDEADAVLQYLSMQAQWSGCAVNWSMAATQAGPCEKALDALVEAHKSFPPDHATPLIQIVREHQAQGPKANT